LKLKRIGVITAVVAVGALALSGCSAGSGNTSEIVSGTSITVAQNQPFTSYNGASATGNTTYNTNITYMTQLGFNYYDSTPKLIKNTKFGTYKALSTNPLTIQYTVNKGVKWSDGTQVGAADMMLAWASGLSKYNDPKGVNFSAAGAGLLDLVKDVPKVSNGGRTITIKYDQPYVDWEVNLEPGLAAQAVYEEAFPNVKNGATADKDLIKAFQTDDTAAITKIAQAWSTKFDMTSLPTDKKLYLSDGPYVLSKLVKNQYVTLVANKKYKGWGPEPKVSKITVRDIPDETAQVQALQNGEISVSYGQADADTVSALKGLSGVTTTTTPTSSYEHVDLTFDNKGPFDPATYGGDAAKALAVRQAFLKALPRQDIVTKLINPIAANEKLDDSQTLLPGAAGYDDSIKANGSSAYQTVDIPGAQALLKQAGVKAPVSVNFMYAKSNPRRAAEFALIQASEKQAGFNVVDKGNDDWGSLLGNKSYDAVLFAWQFTSLAVTGAQAQFTTGGGSNYSGYSNADVDTAYKKLQSDYNKAEQIQLLQQIDKDVWADAYGVTLFQFPDVTAFSNKVKNVKDAPLAPNVFWNYFDWTAPKASAK
jgi:peptide/nickel transport system substrate-binding protein